MKQKWELIFSGMWWTLIRHEDLSYHFFFIFFFFYLFLFLFIFLPWKLAFFLKFLSSLWWILSNFGFSSKTHLEELDPLAPSGSARLELDFPGDMVAKQDILEPFAPAFCRGSRMTSPTRGFWSLFGGVANPDLTHACDFRRRWFLGLLILKTVK